MQSAIVLSAAYLGPVEYYSKLFHYPTVIEQFEHYSKQSYCNRCHIATPDGVLALSIPVIKESGKTAVRDVRLSDHAPWQRTHWRAITSAYSTSPFFEYYADDIAPFFERKWDFLLDFNLEIQAKILELLNIESVVTLSEEYKNADEYAADFRGKIHPKSTAQNTFIENNYYQIFSQKTGFLPNLSIVDLLFNMGNESRIVLKNSEKFN